MKIVRESITEEFKYLKGPSGPEVDAALKKMGAWDMLMHGIGSKDHEITKKAIKDGASTPDWVQEELAVAFGLKEFEKLGLDLTPSDRVRVGLRIGDKEYLKKHVKGKIAGGKWVQIAKIFGKSDFEKLGIKLTKAHLLEVGLHFRDKDYVRKALKSYKPAGQYLPRIKNLLGEKEYDELTGSLSPNQLFTRGFQNGDEKMILDSIKQGATNTHTGMEKAFNWACEYGKVEIVKLLLKDPETDPGENTPDGKRYNLEEGQYGIRRAAKNGHLEVVKELLKDDRVDASYKNNFALKWSISEGHWDVVKELMKNDKVMRRISTLPKKHQAILKDKGLIK